MPAILTDIPSSEVEEIVTEFLSENASNLQPWTPGASPDPAASYPGVYLQPDGFWTVVAFLPQPGIPVVPAPAPVPPPPVAAGPEFNTPQKDTPLNVESPTNFTIYTDLKNTISTLTAGLIDHYFDLQPPEHQSLSGIGKAVIDAARKYAINATYIVSHAILESGWGTSRLSRTPRNNLFGWNAFDSNPDLAKGFKDHAECIDFVMGRVAKLYLDPAGKFYRGGLYVGNKQSGMNVMYAKEADWGSDIALIARRMGKVLGAAAAAGAAPLPAALPAGVKVRGTRAEYVIDHTIAGSSLRIPSGVLSLIADDGTVISSIPANTGGFISNFRKHNGPIPPGSYRIYNYRSPRNDEGTAMRYFDVSFSFSLDPLAGTNVYNRTGLDIHPDGPPPGTHGCIGLVAKTRQQLEDFRDLLRQHTSNGSHFNVDVRYTGTSGVS